MVQKNKPYDNYLFRKMNIGERIKKERMRLGFSQTAFAALGNASKGSQISWEKGLASPNAYVLSAWAQHGLDVVYVLTSEPTEKKLADMKLERDGWLEVLRKFQYFLKLHKYDNELYDAFLLACEDVKNKWNEDGGTNKCFYPIRNILNKSPELILNRAALEDLIERLEFTLSVSKIELTPSAKAGVIMNIYEAIQTGDERISLEMIQRAIPR
jgi:transcriptional regulator with XRE-family HTH domain